MAYKDKETARLKNREYKQKHRQKRHLNKYGHLEDMRGKHDNHAKGSDHYRWNQRQMISEHGYVRVRVGIEHPLADPNGYVYEHQLVWISAGRRLPNSDYVC